MTIPYREWTQFTVRTIKAHGTYADILSNNDPTLWTTDHLASSTLGASFITGGVPPYTVDFWEIILKPSAADFELEDGMSDPIDFLLDADISLVDKHIITRGVPADSLAAPYFLIYILADPALGTWDPALVSGRYKNGVAQWDIYPIATGVDFLCKLWTWGAKYNCAAWATLGLRERVAFYSLVENSGGGGAVSWKSRQWAFQDGMKIVSHIAASVNQPNGTLGLAGEYWKYNLTPSRLQVRYFNPVVNSLSRYSMLAAGGVQLKLNGMGFNNLDAEISDMTRNGGGIPGMGTWADYIQYIYFEGLQGQGQYKLTYPGDFTLDSNLQITIASMPAMAEGTYNIRLKTHLIYDVGVPVQAWAGDWKVAADGRVSKGKRIVFTVGPVGARGTGLMIAGEYAPIDIRVRGMASLIQNGSFNLATDWDVSNTPNPTLASVAGGVSGGNCGRVTTPAGGAGQYIYDRVGSCVLGAAYHFQEWFKKGTASGGFIKIGSTQGGSEYKAWTGLADADWTFYAINFVATSSDIYISLGVEEASKTAFFDEVMFSKGSAFYDGRILGHSAIARSLSEGGAAGTIADMNIELANADRHFSVKLATELLKNQTIETFCAWKDGPEGEKSTVFTGIIDDYSLAGDVFKMTVRDITQKYFGAKIPREIATKEDYPNIHTDADGKPIPVVFGQCVYSAVAANGAVPALYVDKVNFWYLAAAHPLTITAVYADGLIKSSISEYSIVSGINGRVYIIFAADQGERKITFDATGVAYDPWNSPNGYIQNPAYIRAYLLNMIIGLPMAFMDIDSFDGMADFYESIGEDESGYLILNDEKECMEVLQELDTTYGDTGYIAKDGRYALGRKGIADFSTNVNIFAQIDTLGPPEWLYNMKDAINYIKGRFNWYPAPEVYCQSKRMRYDASVSDFGSEMGSEMELPWTTLPAMVDRRLSEELLKLGYGDRKVSFSVPLSWLDDLDLFANIRLQDPFGSDAGGVGEMGHYVYVESMAVDIQGNKIDVVARDYQWVLRAYLVLGDRGSIADNWATADESDRMFAYLCDRTTGYFADGQPGKILADRNNF
jgi:hypothetical protein